MLLFQNVIRSGACWCGDPGQPWQVGEYSLPSVVGAGCWGGVGGQTAIGRNAHSPPLSSPPPPNPPEAGAKKIGTREVTLLSGMLKSFTA